MILQLILPIVIVLLTFSSIIILLQMIDGLIKWVCRLFSKRKVISVKYHIKKGTNEEFIIFKVSNAAEADLEYLKSRFEIELKKAI